MVNEARHAWPSAPTALLWNFHPYSASLRRRDATRRSPFADLNGFQYHDNWYHNLLIAASLGGSPT